MRAGAGRLATRLRGLLTLSSLRARIFWNVVPIVLALFVLVGVATVQQHKYLIEQEFMKRGESMARNLAATSELGVLAEDEELLGAPIRTLEGNTDVAYVLVYGDDARVLARGGPPGAPRPASLELPAALRLAEAIEPFSRERRLGRTRVVEFYAPILSRQPSLPDELLLGSAAGLDRDRARPAGFVLLGLTLDSVTTHINALLQFWGVLTGFFLLASTAAIYAFSRRVTQPVKRLTYQAQRVADGYLDEKIPVESRDEIGQLATAFNEMGASLKGSVDEKERVLAELQELNRTLEDRIAERTGQLERRGEALERSLDEVRALSQINRAVSSSLHVDEVLETVAQNAVGLSRTDACAIFQIDPGRQNTAVVASHNLDPSWIERVEQMAPDVHAAITRRTVESGPSLQLSELGSVENAELREALRSQGYEALLAVPIVCEDLFRAIVLFRKRTGAFEEETVQLLLALADQSKIAIDHARLFQEVEQKNRQLQLADRHKSAFLANMSHELRTPLNAVIGFSEVLIERMFGELNPKQDEYLRDILGSGQHLLSLINDILDLSKIEAGRMELEPAEFDLRATIENAVTLIRERANRHEIHCSTELDPGLGSLTADERKVKQILVNLLSNGVKFTPKGGSLTVRAARREGAAEIAVVDTGIGIPLEAQQEIFEEFRQMGGDYAHKREGTGLGLTLARRFAELHGGRLEVQSAPGRGSTFTVTLPLTPRAPGSAGARGA